MTTSIGAALHPYRSIAVPNYRDARNFGVTGSVQLLLLAKKGQASDSDAVICDHGHSTSFKIARDVP